MTGLKGSDLKDKISRGEAVFGTFMSITDPSVARVFAQLGFDFLLIDMEHCAFNPETLQQILLVFEGTSTCPIVRVPWHEPVWTKWALDFGAEGVLVPNVITAQEAAQAVSNCTYPPAGTRGYFPRAASNFLMDINAYMDGIDNRIQTWIQIEHIDALANLDEILQVPGIDAIFIGPADLSSSMGLLGKYDDPAFLAAIREIMSKAKQAGVPVAYQLITYDDEFLGIVKDGVQIYSYNFDWLFAVQGATAYLQEIKAKLNRAG